MCRESSLRITERDASQAQSREVIIVTVTDTLISTCHNFMRECNSFVKATVCHLFTLELQLTVDLTQCF